jgi:hypothetical protein
MWGLLVGAVEVVAVAGGQVEPVDLFELLDGLDGGVVGGWAFGTSEGD